MEGALYVRELKGETKEKESFFTFLKSIKVLRRRFGKVSLNLGKEIFLDDFTGDILDKDSLDKREKREILQKLAFKIGHEINNARTVNLIALISVCLLDCKEKELSDQELTSYIQDELRYLESVNAPIEKDLKSKFDLILSDSLYELTKLKLIQRNSKNNKLFIPQDKRGIATYYKNTILHFFTVDEILHLGKDNYTDAIDLFEVLKYDFYFSNKVKKEITGEISTPKKERKLLGRSVFYILENYYHGIQIFKEHKKIIPDKDEDIKKFFKTHLQKRLEEGKFLLPESSFMNTFHGLTEIVKSVKEHKIEFKKLDQYLETFEKIKKDFI
jgi:glycerol-3-phosphate O-acyltransferase